MPATSAVAGAPAAANGAEIAQSSRVFTRRNLLVACGCFVVAYLTLVSFQLRIGIDPMGQSQANHYIYQAASLLHGRWDLAIAPSTSDVVILHGKVYMAYPPFPALLLMPFVAIFGLSTSDVFFTALLSACIPGLLFLLFEQLRASGFTQRPWIEHLIFAIFFYLGTITLWLSLGGCVWYTGHIVCMVCVLAALLLALRRHFAWSGLLLACAFLTRYSAILGLPFLLYLAWQDDGAQRHVEWFVASLRRLRPDWSAVPWGRLLPPLAVIAGAVLLLVLRNVMIFASPFETGYTPLLHQTSPEVTQGLFNIRYVPANIMADFFTFPHVIFAGPFDRHPGLDMLNGGPAISVFATTPLFLLLFWRNRRFSMLRVALWLTIALIVGALLFYQNTGWYQFGSRYLFEAYPYAYLLLVASEVRVDLRLALLGVLGIVVNGLGAHQVWTMEIFHL